MKKTKHSYQFVFLSIVGLSVCLLFCVYVFCRYHQGVQVLGTSDTISSTTNKELFVPLGTGVNTTTDWVDVGGSAAYVNAGLYGKMKKITFEASLGVPSGIKPHRSGCITQQINIPCGIRR